MDDGGLKESAKDIENEAHRGLMATKKTHREGRGANEGYRLIFHKGARVSRVDKAAEEDGITVVGDERLTRGDRGDGLVKGNRSGRVGREGQRGGDGPCVVADLDEGR